LRSRQTRLQTEKKGGGGREGKVRAAPTLRGKTEEEQKEGVM